MSTTMTYIFLLANAALMVLLISEHSLFAILNWISCVLLTTTLLNRFQKGRR